ncbi:glycosyltransferase family 4 protein [candidate division CSSED10-310 bacterium]|uniref:Glycosyltransferase family 4 protein n=1 Tax=candidate division CSSED10-310 bacterium TaxID=2855610 RepID=A0ABV6Z3H5_UNCC1
MKLAFIIQRYGQEISGGAEAHARILAQHLRDDFEIEVLTTCAVNYDTWENTLPPSTEEVNGIIIRRFPTDFCKEKVTFDALTEKLIHTGHSYIDELEWLVHQGPYAEELFRYLREKHADYDFLVFYTYLYVTTVLGLAIAPHKSFLIPTAHDEPVIQFSIFDAVFHLPRGIFYLTEEEQQFVSARFKNNYVPHNILGVGFDPPQDANKNRFLEKFKITNPFLLYVGRVDEGKGCQELIDYFKRFLSEEGNPEVTLILAGKKHMSDVGHPRIIMPGYLSESDKNDAFAAATLVLSPSRFESLSLLLLEAFNFEKPVIANGQSLVVTAHCQKSGGGLTYQTYEEFRSALKTLLDDSEKRKKFGQKGKKYVDTHFRWENVASNFKSLLDKVAQNS